MEMQKLNDIFESIDGYISANSLTLTFVVLLAGLLIVLFILIYLFRVNKNIKKQNTQLLGYFENIDRNNKIERSMERINEFNSTDFRIKVLSVLEVKLKMHENNMGDNQSIVDDAEFRYAIINCIHFFNNTGYLYINNFLDNSLIFTDLSGLSLDWYNRLEPYFDLDKDKTVYWKEVNEQFSKNKVLNLDEEINPIGEKTLF